MHSDAYFGMKLGWKYELIPDGRLSSVTTHWPFKSIVCSVARAVSTVIMTRNNNFLEKEYISQRELMLLGYFCPILSYQIFPGIRHRRAFLSHVTQSENESTEINYVCHYSILTFTGVQLNFKIKYCIWRDAVHTGITAVFAMKLIEQ